MIISQKEDEQSLYVKKPKIGFALIKEMSKFQDMRGYASDVLFPIKKGMELTDKSVLIGRTEDDKELYMDLGEACRAVFLARTRGGKTAFVGRIYDSLSLAGWHCIWLTDIKDEIKSHVNPQNRKYYKFMHEKDIPTGIPVKVFRPAFFTNFLGEKLPSQNIKFSIPYKVATITEIFLALSITKESQIEHANAISLYYDTVDNFEDLKKRISNDAQLPKGVKRQLVQRIDVALKYEIFCDKSDVDIIETLRTNPVAVNMNRYRDVGSGDIGTAPMLYVMIIQRLIREAKQKGLLKGRILQVIDEAPAFLQKDTISFDEIHKVVAQDAYLGIYVFFAAQFMSDIPDFILSQSRYVFFNHNLPYEDIKLILKDKARIYSWHPSQVEDMMTQLQYLKVDRGGFRHWVMFDDVSSTNMIFKPFMGVSLHDETRN